MLVETTLSLAAAFLALSSLLLTIAEAVEMKTSTAPSKVIADLAVSASICAEEQINQKYGDVSAA